MPHSTHQALAKLLSACGIPSTPDELRNPGHSDDSGTNSTIKFTEWIPGVSELYHQASSSAQYSGPRHELQAMRTALHLQHGISLVFGGSLVSGSTLPKLEAARRLIRALEGGSDNQCPVDDLIGLKIGLTDQGFGTDLSGTLWLDANATSQSTWTEFLRDADLEWCHKQRAMAQELLDKERRVAAVLGVGLVMLQQDNDATTTLNRVEVSDTYMQLLDNIIDAQQQQQQQQQQAEEIPFLRHVAILIDPSIDEPTIKDYKIRIPLHPQPHPPGDVISIVRAMGPRAAAAAATAAKEESDLTDLRTRVERTLRLRKLSKHPQLPGYKFKAGCLRLCQHAAVLTPLVEGLPLRMGEVNGFVPGEPHIDIAWSFSM